MRNSESLNELYRFPLQVLMPVYNAEQFLAATIDSILLQTYSFWELLIIDDGSTDESLSIIQHYAQSDPRIRFKTRGNEGLVATLNQLVEWSSSPYLARTDADDISSPDRFEKQLAFLAKRPDIDIVGCWIALFGQNQGVWRFRESDNNTRVLSVFGHCSMHHATFICRREVYETVKYNPAFTNVEDFEFLSEIITQTSFKFGNVREVLYRYRMHEDSIVHRYKSYRDQQYSIVVNRHFDRLGIYLSADDYKYYWMFIRQQSANYEETVRIGQLLSRIREKLAEHFTDDFEEFAHKWLKYCIKVGQKHLYWLCKAQDFCFFEEKPVHLEYEYSTDVCSLRDLNACEWTLVGDGGYCTELLRICQDENIRLPNKQLVQDKPDNHPLKLSIDDYDFASGARIVIGSDTFQSQIMTRLAKFMTKPMCFYDCSASMWSSQNDRYFTSPFPEPPTRFIVLFDNDPAKHVSTWLKNFFTYMLKNDIEIVVRHPLQSVHQSHIELAIEVFLWNGSISVFDQLKMKLKHWGVEPSYIECGFFPQNNYFYIDKKGINAQRSLIGSDFKWVTLEMRQQMQRVRARFFGDMEAQNKGYIFVPLQLRNDSNIQNHSRFTNGMQEFIDYIESKYPNSEIIFKKHPKDPNEYHCTFGAFSERDTHSLILQSDKVHGINSTVLFEAVLAGKQVIAEGECLLNLLGVDKATIVAGIIATQYSVDDLQFDFQCLSSEICR